MSDQTNIARIAAVFTALEELSNHVVFVGGATVSLYKDRPASETRVTDDVDTVVDLAGYTGFAVIEDQLRKKGFVNDYIYEWVSSHLDFSEQKRVGFIIAGLTVFINLPGNNTHAV
ncbi:hypothetical protein [Niabella drilacis]|uniref:Nucleotidyl transferase AbiEii toxin, Type IV TA system n=1 Tax=Niabella drilacis (strain DSM 25811 / CCM 8410 / CCUG 62505 / LMG 26954 / E90) TaxID=1285928 RepID=A0A1G6N6C1_NIADE|nr:hypothetical protein [Niabella drilacis]SDC63231.1 hypothetical protein SAMN04487894_103166 [Niabella drilacis]